MVAEDLCACKLLGGFFVRNRRCFVEWLRVFMFMLCTMVILFVCLVVRFFNVKLIWLNEVSING